jgi:hypothetical protein
MRHLPCPRRTLLPRLIAVMVALAPLAAVAQPKPAIHGLVTMGKLNFVTMPEMSPDNPLREANTHPGVYAGAVILATWRQLEPAPGQFDFSMIDAGLASIRAYKARYPQSKLVGKLRVFAGPLAPDWAKQLDGGPVQINEHQRSFPVGHFWSVPYGNAWRKLQVALAARYDTDPLMEEVAISSCASSTAEPFVIPLTPANIPTLEQAGYSDAAMERCLMGAIDDYAPWTHVALDYTVNGFRDADGGRARPDPGFTEQVLEAFRQRLGQRAVLANHGLQEDMKPAIRPVLEDMQRLGPPIEFQTISPNVDWAGAVREGEQVGMTELEIWDSREAGGPAPVTMDELRAWRGELVH